MNEVNEGLASLKEIEKCMVQNCDYADYYKDFETIEEALKEKEKFEELVGMDLGLFMKMVDIKGLIEDYQKFKKALETVKKCLYVAKSSGAVLLTDYGFDHKEELKEVLL